MNQFLDEDIVRSVSKDIEQTDRFSFNDKYRFKIEGKSD